MYLEYADYLSGGGNAAVTAEAYPRLEYAARKKVDAATQKRVQAMATVPEAVKQLMVELINLQYGAEAAASDALSGPVTSFSTDGYSETAAEPNTAQSLSERATRLILQYLDGEADDEDTPLLWLGVSG